MAARLCFETCIAMPLSKWWHMCRTLPKTFAFTFFHPIRSVVCFCTQPKSTTCECIAQATTMWDSLDGDSNAQNSFTAFEPSPRRPWSGRSQNDIAQIDFANAYDSIRHVAIERAMLRRDVALPIVAAYKGGMRSSETMLTHACLRI